MGLSKSDFRDRDIYIEYDFEDVMFRYDHRTRGFFRKFYDKTQEDAVPHDNRLLNDAILYGDEIDAITYQKGKPR